VLCLAYYVCETSWTLLKLRRYGFHVSRYGACVSRVDYILRIFSVMAGWIAEMLFMLFFAYTAV